MDQMKAAAAEPYKERTRWVIDTLPESDFRLQDYLGENIIGDYHSHPEHLPTASKVDKDDWIRLYPDGMIAIITAIWPTKKSPGFTFRHKAYTVHLGKVYRAQLIL